MSDVAKNLQDIQAIIRKTAAKWDRESDDIDLIAVSKKQPLDRVVAALEAGHRVFGENRVQEAQNRWGALAPRFPGVEIHGPVAPFTEFLNSGVNVAIYGINAAQATEIYDRVGFP